MHGKFLGDFEEEGKFLIAILKVLVRKELEKILYPYNIPGDEVPSTLGAMSASGFYAWDKNTMQSAY